MRVIQKILLVPFCFALFLAILGCIITFIPSAECGWFLIAGVESGWFLVVALLSVSGLFIPKARIGAFLLLVFALYAAYGAYHGGVESHQRHSSQQIFVYV